MEADDIWKWNLEQQTMELVRNSQRESTVAGILGPGGGKWASNPSTSGGLAVLGTRRSLQVAHAADAGTKMWPGNRSEAVCG
jgi:hypothetical protein